MMTVEVFAKHVFAGSQASPAILAGRVHWDGSKITAESAEEWQDAVNKILGSPVSVPFGEDQLVIKPEEHPALWFEGLTKLSMDRQVLIEKEVPTQSDVHVGGPAGVLPTAGGPPAKPSRRRRNKEKDDPGTDPLDLPEQEADAELMTKRISGNSDVPLNAKGERLGESLGKRLRAKGGLDVLHASPLARAQQTADLIEKNARPGSLSRGKGDEALCPWHFPGIEGKSGKDVANLIAHYVEHPDEVPPGDGADGEPGEPFKAAVKRQLDFLSRIRQDAADDPTMKIGVVMHARGMELAKAWADAGCPEDYAKINEKDLLSPDDPEHASVMRWKGDEIKDVDLDSDDPLKSGVYLIMHSLTDDDTDEGNEQLEKTYTPTWEMRQAARRALADGHSVEGVTVPLSKAQRLSVETLRKISSWFADTASASTTSNVIDSWGGKRAKIWADKVLRKTAGPEIVEKAGNGVMLAFFPPRDLAEKWAPKDGETPDQIHLTLIYFGTLAEVPLDKLKTIESVVQQCCASYPPVDVSFSGLGRFPASPNSDGKDVVYLGAQSASLMEFRQRMVSMLEAAGVTPKPSPFSYTPHVSLKFVEPSAVPGFAAPAPSSVTFGQVTLSVGGAQKQYPLSGDATAVDKTEVGEFSFTGTIEKVDQDQHLVFGWFSIVQVDGRIVEDTQGDRIDAELELEPAAYRFVLEFRVGGEMHSKSVALLVESCVFTREKVKAMQESLRQQGINATIDLKCVAWWGGFKVMDPNAWEGVTSGRLKAWSIGGTGAREKVEV